MSINVTLITFQNDDLLSSTLLSAEGTPFPSHVYTYDLSTFWYIHNNEAGFVKEGKGESIRLSEKGIAKLLSVLKIQQIANEDEFIKLTSDDLNIEITYDHNKSMLEKIIHLTDIAEVATEKHAERMVYILHLYDVTEPIYLSKKGYERLDNLLAHRKQQPNKAKFRYIQNSK